MSDYTQQIERMAKALVREGKGILAADESTESANKRFVKRGIPETEEMRRQWRELLLTTPEIENGLTGVILYDETIRQKTTSGKLFTEVLSEKGIVPGIKVDMKTYPLVNFPGEVYTAGLDGLRERLAEYREMGAGFAKWRGVITIDSENDLPTQECIDANAYLFAQYAGMCQAEGIVPIVEPEVLLDGKHTIDVCAEITERTHTAVFQELRKYRVNLKGMILKTGMVLPGNKSGQRVSAQEIAQATVRVLTHVVPEEVPGVVFLSGGQKPIEATENLNEISKLDAPWPLTFSYSRAIQQPVMDVWDGKVENIEKAQAIYIGRINASVASLKGEYTREMEPEGVEE